MTKIRNIKILSIVLLIAILATACFKQPVYDDVPEIAFKAFDYTGSEYIVDDSGFLLLTFTDGDGDIGKDTNDDPTLNLFIETVYSFTNPLTEAFVLPNVPYNGTTDDISGEIKIRLNSIYDESEYDLRDQLAPGLIRDTVTMNIRIKDRAGNYSNTITTPKLPRYFP
ncbi:MAG: hypothetical protein H6553_05985 [Chitinophagales bacterium]|nr:hypothetical protein [Chitinophagales bacterium]